MRQLFTLDIVTKKLNHIVGTFRYFCPVTPMTWLCLRFLHNWRKQEVKVLLGLSDSSDTFTPGVLAGTPTQQTSDRERSSPPETYF